MLVNFNYKNLGFRCKLAASILLRDLVEMTTHYPRTGFFSPLVASDMGNFNTPSNDIVS